MPLLHASSARRRPAALGAPLLSLRRLRGGELDGRRLNLSRLGPRSQVVRASPAAFPRSLHGLAVRVEVARVVLGVDGALPSAVERRRVGDRAALLVDDVLLVDWAYTRGAV